MIYPKLNFISIARITENTKISGKVMYSCENYRAHNCLIFDNIFSSFYDCNGKYLCFNSTIQKIIFKSDWTLFMYFKSI